jgi:hypothetical protein
MLRGDSAGGDWSEVWWRAKYARGLFVPGFDFVDRWRLESTWVCGCGVWIGQRVCLTGMVLVRNRSGLPETVEWASWQVGGGGGRSYSGFKQLLGERVELVVCGGDRVGLSGDADLDWDAQPGDGLSCGLDRLGEGGPVGMPLALLLRFERRLTACRTRQGGPLVLPRDGCFRWRPRGSGG